MEPEPAPAADAGAATVVCTREGGADVALPLERLVAQLCSGDSSVASYRTVRLQEEERGLALTDAVDLDDVAGVGDSAERVEIAELLSSALLSAAAGVPEGNPGDTGVASLAEPGSEEAGTLAGLRKEAEAKHGAERILTLTVPYGAEYVDTTLLRFLRARSGVLAQALEMIGDCLELREREQVDTILSRPLAPAVLQHIHSCYDEGWLPSPDKLGRPVYILVGGRTGERLAKLFSPPVEGMAWELADVTEAFMHWHLQMMEYLNRVVYARFTQRAGKLVNKFVMIDDLSGMSTKGVTQIMKFVDIMKRMSEVDQLLYPEGLGTMYFVNAPWLFSGPWKAISSLLTEDTRRRVHVVSAEETEAVLKQTVDAEALPTFLGGELEGEYVTGPEVLTTDFFKACDASAAAPFPSSSDA